MDVDLVTRLAAGSGRELLARLPPYRDVDAVAWSTRLRREGHDPELVAAVLSQARLRDRAGDRLGPWADRLLLTPDGLEQATRWPVALRHARRLAATGARRVWDLGCGIGVDALAMTEAGLAVTAVEADPVTAAVARANLTGRAGSEVLTARAEDLDLPRDTGGQAAWFDPARRAAPGAARHASGRARRLFRLEELSPSWDQVTATAARFPAAGAKLAPAFPRQRVPAGVLAEWVSVDGALLECALWWGSAAGQETGPRAVVARAGAWHVLTPDEDGVEDGDEDERAQDEALAAAAAATREARGPATTGDLGDWLYEPDGAVVQAGLMGTLARRLGARDPEPGAGYLIGDRATDSPFARRFAVLGEAPATGKRLRGWARERHVGELVLKKRGAPVDLDRLRQQVGTLRGGERAVVALTRLRGRTVALHLAPADGG
ncbi:THUMP-like domain-containing protein [Ornithinicoccus halotolerans]|uniref:THUMP-like domain-containing protein n=1 Tax=Ornithinicoccus halotolerans TaxID=1748220 RepID=UPI001E63575E|nr:methyltransferase domain-containing protein [Ornithinicoccus halotolerans]